MLERVTLSADTCAAPCTCRCKDLPASHVNKREFTRLLAIIPGPREPLELAPYLEPILRAFKRYGPRMQPASVTPPSLQGLLVDHYQGMKVSALTMVGQASLRWMSRSCGAVLMAACARRF